VKRICPSRGSREKLVNQIQPKRNSLSWTNSVLAKRKRDEEKAKKESMDKGISNYFTKGPIVAQPKAKVGLTDNLKYLVTKEDNSL